MHSYLLDVPKQPPCMNGSYGELYQQLLSPSRLATAPPQHVSSAHVTPVTSHVAFSPRSGWSSVLLASDPGGISGLQNVVHRQNLGNFTNHSLCATGAGIPEAIIQKRTGQGAAYIRTYFSSSRTSHGRCCGLPQQ